ncbi:MAG: inorganic phosphate transporter [Methanomicrobiales archaeon]|nr:inorganic phosphate transporter [Methanomicrobiales archaeon]MDI6877015.1 inorganic phosphate transporter [Methanomicrobiales archaeon]
MLEMVLVALTFAFAFTNGFQDASTIAATFIASRSATPRRGILFIAGLQFAGALLGGTAVAFTLSSLLAFDAGPAAVPVLLTALLGAIAWNLLTWRYALPSSSTHALIGGLVGAGVAYGGPAGIFWGVAEFLAPPHELAGLLKILVFLAVSLAVGLLGGFALHRTAALLLRNARRGVVREIARSNWIAAGFMAFFNGANDGGKLLGIVLLGLGASGTWAGTGQPLWARLGIALLITLGTVGGGWRIMATLGRRIFKIEPLHSFSSQFSSGASIALSTLAGAPISSTHVITSSVLGVGAAENPRRVRWSVGRDIVASMLLTLPATALLTAFMYWLIAPFL